MHFSVFSLVGISALIVTDSLPKGDNYLGASRRTKRGVVKDTAKILGKAGKYVARIWRVRKAKRVLVQGAMPIKPPHDFYVRGNYIYSKIGGTRRAEMDFMLTFPDNVHTIRDNNGIIEMGDIENYRIHLLYSGQFIKTLSRTGVFKQCNGKTVKCAIQLCKSNDSGNLAETPITIIYLE